MANYFNKDTIIYLDGAFVKAADTKMNLYSQSLHYGFAVFEGIRSYKTKSVEAKIFKAKDHYKRLRVSAVNNLQGAYIRPLVYVGEKMNFNKNTRFHLKMPIQN